MNPYFWLFSLCALLMTPMTAHITLRLDRGLHYRIRLQAAGLPFAQKTEKEEQQEEETVQTASIAKRFFTMDHQLLTQLLRGGHMGRALKVLHVQKVDLYARIAFSDAAATALVYALGCTALQAFLACAPHRYALQVRMEAEWNGGGTKICLRCIAGARLGNLALAAIRLGVAALRTRSGLAKEEQHAASH